jgi:2-keto-4-pentenoate hydratase/2-oxohepta-3-ene-1,7-dioic acid hydratase in catechol pathway
MPHSFARVANRMGARYDFAHSMLRALPQRSKRPRPGTIASGAGQCGSGRERLGRRQQSRTSQLIFNCDYLVSFISQVMTLLPGDVISTGTPAGVGAMKVGNVVEVEIEHIGCLKNTIAAPR